MNEVVYIVAGRTVTEMKGVFDVVMQPKNHRVRITDNRRKSEHTLQLYMYFLPLELAL